MQTHLIVFPCICPRTKLLPLCQSASVSQHHVISPSSKHPVHTPPIHHALLPHYPIAGSPVFPAALYKLPAIMKKWICFKHDLLACHNLSHYLNSSTIALKIRGHCGFWGAEVWNVVLTMKLHPPPPSTRELIQLQLSCCGQILSTAPYHMGKS